MFTLILSLSQLSKLKKTEIALKVLNKYSDSEHNYKALQMRLLHCRLHIVVHANDTQKPQPNQLDYYTIEYLYQNYDS